MEKPNDLIDSMSEMIALSCYRNTKNLLITAAELKGPVDTEAIKLAVHRAAEAFPQLTGCLREIKREGRHYLAREQRPDLDFPVRMSELGTHSGSRSILEAVLNHLEASLDRNRDLFTELPGEFHLVKVAEHHHVAVPVINHVAADAVVASAFGQRTVLEYSEIVTGIRPDLLDPAFSISTAKKRPVAVKKRKYADILVRSLLTLSALAQKPSIPAGHGRKGDQRQFHVKRVLPEGPTERLTRPAAGKRIRFIDLLVASCSAAVDAWNGARNVRPGTVTTAVTVNVKGRYSGVRGPNNASVLFFRTRPEDRQDIPRLAELIATARTRQFRNQMDFKLRQNTARTADSLRILPFGPRRRIVHFLMQRHRFSIAVTQLGVVWPLIINGVPTAESFPTSVGDMEITEIHGVGYKLLSGTQLLLIVYIYRRRLNLVLASSASLFTREDTEAFLDAIVDVLLNSARLVDPQE